MNVFDTDRNGFLDAWEQANQKRFRYADGNSDGALNRQEFSRIKSRTTSF